MGWKIIPGREAKAVFSGMTMHTWRFGPALVCLLAACGSPRGGPVVRGEQVVRGDTAVIRASGDGEWGPIQDAVEEKRATNGEAPATFGQASSAIALPSGGALVFDVKAPGGPVLELFDSAARFVTAIGRQGKDLGQFQALTVVSLAANRDGTIFVLDQPNSRVDRFAADGHALKPIPVGSVAANGSPDFLRAGANGSVYVWSYVVRERGLRDAEMTGYYQYDSTGKVLDSIAPQHLWFPPPPRARYAPADQWSALGDGRVILSRTDLVGFLVKPAIGTNGMVLAMLDVPAAAIDTAERRQIQTMVDFWDGQLLAHDKAPMQHEPVPDHKPAIREVMPDADGRVWVQRNVASVRVPPHPAPGASHLIQSFDQPTVWSAFRLNGNYLGDVRFPIGVRVIGVSDDVAWAVVPGKDERQVLVKYRIPGIVAK